LTYWNVVRSGDYFTFYTPYHLVTNEIPLSIVWAVEDHEAVVVPQHGPLTEVIGAAKSNLKAGTMLDGGGGYTVYAQNDLAHVAKKEGLVPFGLLEGAKLIKDVKADQVITTDMVELKTDALIYHLRKLQDELIPPTEMR
jgi:predicted homoserine dehydrogenase-like protein